MVQSCGYGGYSSAAERLTVAQDVVGSIPTSRPNSYKSLKAKFLLQRQGDNELSVLMRSLEEDRPLHELRVRHTQYSAAPL
jgi:hypothetical protein